MKIHATCQQCGNVLPDTGDAALRAKYASAVRTLQDIARLGWRDAWQGQMARITLTQLGEPVEPGETT